MTCTRLLAILAVVCLPIPAGTELVPHDLTSNTSHSPYVTSASTDYGDCFRAWQVLDGVTGGGGCYYWLGTNGGKDWWKIDLGSGNGRILRGYVVRVNAVPEPDRAPNDWTIEGSDNDSDWTTVDTVADQSSWGSAEARTFYCDTQTTAYRYFRLNITSNKDSINISCR